MEEEEDLQEVWTYSYLEGMAPYSYYSSIPSGLDRSWAIASSSSDVSAI